MLNPDLQLGLLSDYSRLQQCVWTIVRGMSLGCENLSCGVMECCRTMHSNCQYICWTSTSYVSRCIFYFQGNSHCCLCGTPTDSDPGVPGILVSPWWTHLFCNEKCRKMNSSRRWELGNQIWVFQRFTYYKCNTIKVSLTIDYNQGVNDYDYVYD